MISSQVGRSLWTEAQSATVTLNMVVDATTTPNTEVNVIADSPRGDRDRTIVVGAHLDSVAEGPGINDNGSGSSGILEIAEEVAELRNDRPRNRLRFAFWGAEEAGLVGSTAYVAEQVQNGGIEDIEANLNFDMIGMPFDPNYHEDGDTFFNLSYTALDQMSDAAAHATWTLAESRSEVTDARAAKVKRGKKGSWSYEGPFRVR